jgi:hypothetical protein
VIEPYAFIRTVTLALGVTWSVMAAVRILRNAAEWKQKLTPLGLEEREWRRWIALACLRATVLDPLNLALLCLLVGLWTLPGRI